MISRICNWGFQCHKNLKVILLVFLSSVCLANGQNEQLFLTDRYSKSQVNAHLLDIEEWSLKASENIEMDNLPNSLKEKFIQNAEAFLGLPLPMLTANLTLEYSINGNRENYQAKWFERRNRLTDAVLAECVEGKGRFINEIVDEIWAICEETWWGFPAHYYQYGQVGLPDVQDEYVDLFAAETGVLLVWTKFLLQKELDEISPIISQRIALEVDKRIIKPNLEHIDFHWMGYNGEDLNNWTPWICSNWLACLLFLEDDEQKRVDGVYKIMEILDKFLKAYPEDGGCNEGPAYWNRAGGSLYDCLELLEEGTSGVINIWDRPVIKNMGTYIYKSHIGNDYYVNFADATAKVFPDAALIYQYGSKIKDSTMIKFGSWLHKKNEVRINENEKMDGNNRVLNGNITREIRKLKHYENLNNTKPEEPLLGKSWFPNSQIVTLRENANSLAGFYMAAKGGHNKESHNHNDVGNYIVYYDGKPVLIDLGLETYTQKSFSDQRYDIWITQSQYHNLPTINGEMQADGRNFKADHVNYNDERSAFSLDISGAYPKSASVKKWQRTISLSKKSKSVQIIENYQLSKSIKPIVLNLMTDIRPKNLSNTKLAIQIPGEDSKMITLNFPIAFEAIIEELPILDPMLKNSWGDEVFRIKLIQKNLNKKGNIVLELDAK